MNMHDRQVHEKDRDEDRSPTPSYWKEPPETREVMLFLLIVGVALVGLIIGFVLRARGW